jgi:hypothetical protein
MADLLAACDFSSVYIPSVTDAQAQALARTVALVQLGFDSGPDSAQVYDALSRAGILLDVYRLPVSWRDIPAQVNDTIQGIYSAVSRGSPLPGYYCLDIEPTSGQYLSIAQIEAAMDTVEAADIRPTGTEVKPMVYSAPWVWDAYPGYTGPADRGWFVWGAGWKLPPTLESTPLFGGFRADQVVGHQYDGSTAMDIGTVDVSVFAARTVTPDPLPPAPDVIDAVTRILRAQNELTNALANLRT